MNIRSPRIEHHDWHEVKAMAEASMVVLIPAATMEQHGPHLPCDVDNLIVQYLCDETAKRRPELCTVAPLIPFGFNEHNMGFPGCIGIGPHTLIELYADIAESFTRMGFRKILFLNGHGSNPTFLTIASRMVVNKTEAHVGTVNHWDLISDVIAAHRESVYPGGCAHAGELETSLYLHICPERVRMELAVKENQPRWAEQFWVDLQGGGPVAMCDDWSRINQSGVEGDPLTASAEKGKIWAEATIERLTKFLDEYRARKILPRRNFNHVPEDPKQEK
ncbi:MAG: creatininase family protein [Planctomycetota bacterium]|nr:creatininase family protein [Planctomycetota bacterium]MDA1139135.1 creatininase family protein [Planctomycetota bacterium]